MKLNLEVGDLVCFGDNNTPYLVCKVTEVKYGLYDKELYTGLLYMYKEDYVQKQFIVSEREREIMREKIPQNQG